ncbi:zinc ribbon domain-containing protein, partial [Athalassotoga sp.]|uniref:zinc ribbon domain-containing protein n=1 Tax=Athalassotoga sp. TaxID=2022597 RepID=UPI003D03D639
VCGYEKAELSLNEREWECPNCHTIHDRDINAAINIKHQGLHMLGYDENRGAHGDSSLILSTEVLLSEKPPTSISGGSMSREILISKGLKLPQPYEK